VNGVCVCVIFENGTAQSSALLRRLTRRAKGVPTDRRAHRLTCASYEFECSTCSHSERELSHSNRSYLSLIVGLCLYAILDDHRELAWEMSGGRLVTCQHFARRVTTPDYINRTLFHFFVFSQGNLTYFFFFASLNVSFGIQHTVSVSVGNYTAEATWTFRNKLYTNHITTWPPRKTRGKKKLSRYVIFHWTLVL
jgi:hypothetical protein